jgi:O-antigen ligase
MYFFWVEDVSSGYINYLGGQSLRSAKLISEDYEFKTTESEFSLSQYDEITTAHNGFLTFAVEFGLLPTLLILISLVILFTKNSYRLTKVENLIFLMIITQNLTNDLIYSPDVAIYFWIFPFLYLIYNFENYESKSP